MRYLLLLCSLNAFAYGGEGVPFKEIGFQALNFFAFCFLLFLILRNPVKTFFKTRRELFLREKEEALKKEKEMIKEHQLWSQKTKDLVEQEKNLIFKVSEEGDRLKAYKNKEIKDLSERLKREQEFFVHLEKEKAKKQILESLQSEVVQGVKGKLKEKGEKEAFQSELYKNFSKGLRKI